MAELIAPEKLRTTHSMGYEQVEKALANLQPVHTMPMGKGVMKLYDKDQADLAIQAYKVEQERAKTAAKATPLAGPAIGPVLDQISEINGRVDLLNESVAKLQEQNRLLLRAIESMRADVLARSDALAGNVDQLLLLARTVQPPAETSAAAPSAVVTPIKAPAPDVRQKKVMVVGVEPGWFNQLEREFGKEFELSLVKSDDARGQGFVAKVARMDHIIAMTAFINDGIRTTQVAAGDRLIRLSGGLSMLRDKLVELYCKPMAA